MTSAACENESVMNGAAQDAVDQHGDSVGLRLLHVPLQHLREGGRGAALLRRQVPGAVPGLPLPPPGTQVRDLT